MMDKIPVEVWKWVAGTVLTALFHLIWWLSKINSQTKQNTKDIDGIALFVGTPRSKAQLATKENEKKET